MALRCNKQKTIFIIVIFITHFVILESNFGLNQSIESSDVIEPSSDIKTIGDFRDKENYTLLGQLDNNFAMDFLNDMFIEGNLSFIAAGFEGMLIFNISDRENPRMVGQFFDVGYVQGVFVTNGLAYLSVGSPGLEIVNVTNPTNPTKICQIDTEFEVIRAITKGNLTYLVQMPESTTIRIDVYDIISLYNPRKIGSIDEEFVAAPQDIAIINNYLYVTTGFGIFIYEITPTGEITQESFIRDYINFKNSFVTQDYIYIVSDVYGLIIYENKIGEHTLVGRYLEGLDPYDVVIDENESVAYVASLQKGLAILDISDKGNPTLLNNQSIGGIKRDLGIVDDYIFVLDTLNLLQVFTLADPLNPALIYTHSISGYTNELIVKDNFVFLADGASGLEIIDISDKQYPFMVATFIEEGYNTTDVKVVNQTIYLADQNFGLVIVNATEPSNPTKIANWTDGGNPWKVFIQNTTVFLIDRTDGIEVFNVSNPQNPVKLTTYSLENANDLFVLNQTAFVAVENQGIEVLNITDLTNLALLSSYSSTGPANALEIDGNYLYLADGSHGVEIYNISNHASIELLNTYSLSSYVESISVNNSYLYLACKDEGTSILNRITNTSLELIGKYSDGGEANALFIQSDFLFVADGIDNLEIISRDRDDDSICDYLEIYFYFTNPDNVDSDEDGLTDEMEVLITGSNPWSSDSDGDLMSDLFELTYGLLWNFDDSGLDADLDGLTNLHEYQLDLNPRDEDTDRDYLTDYEEVIVYLTEPNNPDSDGDGWPDGYEIYYETDPWDPSDHPPGPLPDPDVSPYSTPPGTVAWVYYVMIGIVGSVIISGIVYMIVINTKKPSGEI